MSMQAPPGRGSLDVHLGGQLLGTLDDRTMGFVAFDFTQAAILRNGVGSRVLSLALPVARETVDPFVTTPFFAGLLPEGAARARLCAEFRVSPDDPWALLRILGRESAGALIILPPGELLPSVNATQIEPLDDTSLARELSRLHLAPLGVRPDGEVRLSLAGVQGKLPLVQLPSGQLGLTRAGHPSTHIAKPAHREDRFPELVANEAYCLTVSSELGVPTTSFAVLDVRGEPLLLVERFDRRRGEDGSVERIHQEDACQATATYPAFKYETAGGPSLERIGRLLDEHSSQPAVDRMTLFRLTSVNALLGNCDAHGKNISFLHDAGGVRLSPAYDIVSTEAYDHTDELGMRIGGIARLRDIDRVALLRQAESLGIPARLAERILSDIGSRLEPALTAARTRAQSEGWLSEIVDRVAEATLRRAGRLLT